MSTIIATDTSFASEILKADRPVVVDFWAEWCAPCKAISEALEELAGELAGKVVIARVNIEENQATARNYGVRGLPTLMLFRDGQVASMKIGTDAKTKLRDWIEANI